MKIQHISYCGKILPLNVLKKNQYQLKSEQPDTFDKQYYYSATAFKGITSKGLVKQRGMLMHITSLPAHRSFCGQFCDPQTTEFINWLAKSKQTHWIMNPLNALEDNLCPYSAAGRFSRNKFIVNLNKLTEKSYGKLLKKSELPDDITVPEFTLEMLEKQKNPRFKIAYERFKNLAESTPIKQEYNKFIKENNSLWVDDYANYDVLSRKFGPNWTLWSRELQTAPEDAKREGISLNDKIISILKKQDKNLNEQEIKDGVNLYKFEQFLYDKQFNEQVKELKSKNINLIMDLPIGVSACGVDTWGKKSIFLLDKDFQPTKVSGCPSEPHYPYTQVWGHALYNYDSPEFWDYQEASIRQLLRNADLRLDHFVGYVNRSAIPTEYKKADGTILRGNDIFKPVEDGGMGAGFYLPEWTEDIYSKTNNKGENVFQLFMRIAREVGKKPEDTFILENFGPLAKTKAYKKFDKKYGKNFISQRVPIGMGIKDSGTKKDSLNSPFGQMEHNIALLTGNHDLPSLRETVEKLIGIPNTKQTNHDKKAHKIFDKFCDQELMLTEDEKKNRDIIFENVMKWFYTKNVKQVQTTLQDALGIWWRPNIPGFWNGHIDKFLLKPTPEGLLPFWNKVFPKNFLSRDCESGINPGYKKRADNYTNMMNDLYR